MERIMPEKCFWCYRESLGLQEMELQFKGKSSKAKVCNKSCGNELKDFIQYAENHNKHYIIGLTLSIIVGLIIAFWRIKVDFGALGVFILFAGSGLTLIKYPFVTPETVASLGARKAIASGRFIGWLNITIGIVFWFFLAVYLSY
jgi:uncharacterized membrane protein